MIRRLPRLWTALSGIALVSACGSPPVRPAVRDQAVVDQEPAWPVRPEVQGKVAAQFPTVRTQGIRRSPGAGLELVTALRDDQPMVHLRWVIQGGRGAEWTAKGPRWPEGTMAMTAQLLTKGSKSHPGASWAEAIEGLGGSLQVRAAADAVVIEGQVLSHNFPQFLVLLRETLDQPQLDNAAIESLRSQVAADLRAELGDAAVLAQNLALRLVFGEGHTYASRGPTLASLAKIKRKQITEAWQAGFRLGGSTLVTVGPLASEAVAQAVEANFGDLLEKKGQAPEVALPVAATGDTCHVIDVPAAAQAALVQVAAGPPRRARIWPQLTVANQILGGSASSRLFSELREKRGWTYGVYSGLDGRRLAGRWSIEASLQPEAIGPALGAIEDQLLQLRRVAAPGAELSAATRYLAGQFALSLASGDQIAEYLAAAALYGLPGDYWSHYADVLQDVSADQALEAAVQAIPASGRITVAAGPLGQLRPSLDSACRTLYLHSPGLTGPKGMAVKPKVLLGSDAEMGDDGRKLAFGAWQRGPGGALAVERYATDTTRNLGFRALALTALARGDSYAQVAAIGRKSADWHDELAPTLARLLLGALHDPDAKVQSRARFALLQLAASAPSAKADLDRETAAQLRAAVAEWAMAGVDGAKPAAEIKALAEARLDPGDVAQLGEVPAEALEQWIAADVRRHEAAAALVAAKTPAATGALVKGYRRLFATGLQVVDRDLAALGSVRGIDALVLLLDLHANVAALDQPDAATRTAAVIATARQLADQLANTPATQGGGSELALRFERIDTHMDQLLEMRNADDRWWAAGLLIEYRKVPGLRRVLAGLRTDIHYRLPQWHTLEPPMALAALARKHIAELGLDAEPALLAGLAGRNPMGKVVAVAGLKALGSEGALSALRTCNDATAVGEFLSGTKAISVRDLALAAVDVHKFYTEVEAEVAAGRLSRATAMRYRESAYHTMGLSGRALRESVVAEVAAEPDTPDAGPAATTPPAASTESELP
jgi:zinc protease